MITNRVELNNSVGLEKYNPCSPKVTLSQSSSLSSQSSKGFFSTIFAPFIAFFKWLAELFCCCTFAREIKPVPKDVEDHWNSVIEFDWIPEGEPGSDEPENTCRIGNTASDFLAIACKQEGIKTPFKKILIDEKNAWGIWFTAEVGYANKRSSFDRGEYNNRDTLFLIAASNNQRPSKDDLVNGSLNCGNKRSKMGDACFAFLTQDEYALIRDKHALPEWLKELLTKGPDSTHAAYAEKC